MMKIAYSIDFVFCSLAMLEKQYNFFYSLFFIHAYVS